MDKTDYKILIHFGSYLLNYFFFKLSSSQLDIDCKFRTKFIRENKETERASVLQKDDTCIMKRLAFFQKYGIKALFREMKNAKSM